MIQKLIENCPQLVKALGELGFEHYSALQQIVDQDKDLTSIRQGVADDAVRQKSQKLSVRQPSRTPCSDHQRRKPNTDDIEDC